jgi:hypothetical protein
LENNKSADVELALKDMVEARNIVQTEIQRIINDPVTGKVNKDLILESKERMQFKHRK